MIVRLEQIGDEPYDWHETLRLASEEFDHPEVLALGEIDCRGQLSRSDPGFLLRARLAYDQTLRCTRCLGTTPPIAVESDVDLLILVNSAAAENDEERELAVEDLGVVVLAEPVLDTQPIVVEQVQLNVPMKPLCREDCAGLCPRCGADLNLGPCECQTLNDPRWAGLSALRQRLPE